MNLYFLLRAVTMIT